MQEAAASHTHLENTNLSAFKRAVKHQYEAGSFNSSAVVTKGNNSDMMVM